MSSLALAFAAPLPCLRRPSSHALGCTTTSTSRTSTLRPRRPRLSFVPLASIIPERPPDGYKNEDPFATDEDDNNNDNTFPGVFSRDRQDKPSSKPTDDLPPNYRDPPLFVDEKVGQRSWRSLNEVDVTATFAPLRDDEAAALRRALPAPIANFFLARADDAVRLRGPADPSDNSVVGRLLNDLPPDVPDWEAAVNAEYADYTYVTATGPPSFRRKGSALFGGGDGLPDPGPDGLVGVPYDESEDVRQGVEPLVKEGDPPNKQARELSLFVGQVDSVDEQASRTGYSILAVLGLLVLIKIILAFVSFFVSFTFSFLAIFALSAGIFVVFFLLRF